MTLIAATLNFGRPIMISDCLVTADGVANPPQIPLLPKDYIKYLPANKKNLPVGLVQKMYIINKQICISFATEDDREIRAFLPIFKDYFPEGSFISNERIHEFLDKYDLRKTYSKSSLFIFYFNRISDHSIQVGQFFVPPDTIDVNPSDLKVDSSLWNILEEPIFEKTWAHALGTDKFLGLIAQPVFSAESSIPKEDMARAIQMNGALIARILALQMTAEGFYSIQDDWGGAYELSFFNGHEFEKLNDYAYIIWHSEFDKNGDIGIPSPIFVLHYRYVKGTLYVTEIRGEFDITEREGELEFVARPGKYAVRVFAIENLEQIASNKPTRFPADMSFNTEVVGMGYSLITPRNTMFNPGLFTLGNEVQVTYRKNRNVKITLKRFVTDRIRQQSKERYPHLR